MPGETVNPSGLVVVSGGQRRSTAQIVRDIENRTPEEAAAVGRRALDEVLSGKPAQEPVSLADSKADTIAKQLEQDGVAELTPRQIAARKGAATRKANREKALEIKQAETIGGSKPDPVPNVTPEPAPMRVVQGEAPDRLEQKRNHPAFTSKLPEAPPPLSVVKSDLLEYSTETPTYPRGVENARLLNEQTNLDNSLSNLVNSPEGTPLVDVMKINPRTWDEDRVLDLGEGSIDNPIETKLVGEGDLPVRATTKAPPRQRPNETAEAYGKRLNKWQLQNSGEVFKAPAGFEQPRGTTSFREGAMDRIEGGMSRTRRSVAFIDDGSGISPEGFPVQREGESVRDFNLRASEFLRARGKPTPEAPDNSFLAQGTPEPVSLAGSKEAAAAGSTPPKPKGLGRNAFYDAEKGQWVKGRLDKKSGKIVAQEERTVYATEEDRIAGQKAYEAQRNADKRAKRAADRVAKETELKAAATPVDSSAEYGPFMFAGQPLGRSRVVLEPGQVPDWAQQNVSLSGEAKPLSEIENAWLTKEMTPEEDAFFRELGNAKKASAGRRVVRSTRQPTPEEVKEYVTRFRGLRAERTEENLLPGATPVALTDTQIQLEKEIEQVLGTNAMIALKNVAIRGNTPPLTQNVRGLESLAEIKATSGEPLINKLVVRQATPTSSGKLREQAANFFNADGRLKGVSGADRVRTWNRLTKSDWFRQLQEREPSFANFLREQNSDIAGRFDPMLAEQVEQLPKPGLRRMRTTRNMSPEEEESFIAGQLASEQTDDGLGSYSLRFGDTPEEGLRARDSGTTVEQRSQAAQIEDSLMRRQRLLRQIKAEDQAAFGDIEYLNRGFERGQQLDPMVDPNVTRDYGIVDEKGFTNINAAEFRSARRQLNQDIVLQRDLASSEASDVFEAKQREILDATPGKENKEERKRLLGELAANPEPRGLPSNPFAQEFGTELPTGYVREIPESFGKTQEAAEKAQRKEQRNINRQAALSAKMELERESFYSTRWLDVAKQRAIAARSMKPEPTPMYDKFGPVRSEASIREEAQRLASLERKAEKARAAAPRGKTAEEIRFELKNPVFGPEAPAGSRSSWGSDVASAREEEAKIAREMMSDFEVEQFDMDLSDIFRPED